jgi:phosphoribosylformylglycinamidine cyclo-ligase
MLNGIVTADEIDIAGCAVGYVPSDRAPLTGEALAPGDEIVLVASSGLHTNGASLARRAAEVAGGLETELPDGSVLGDALLTPSAIYVKLIERLYADGVPLTYASHITGHGLRKVMRANRELSYRVARLLETPESLRFIVRTLDLSARDAYGTLNMGMGFALFCPPGAGERAVATANSVGHQAIVAGVVEEGPRQVILEPVDVTFADEELQLR